MSADTETVLSHLACPFTLSSSVFIFIPSMPDAVAGHQQNSKIIG